MEQEPTYIILRRAPVPDDRKPRRILPGDYFAVIVNSKANRGNVAAITSYFDHSMAPTFGEIDLGYYWRSVKATLEETPKDLVRSFQDIEPPGPVIYRQKLTRRDLERQWEL